VAVECQRSPARPPAPHTQTGKPVSASPITDSIKSTFEMVKDFIMRSAAMLGEKDYTFKPAGVPAEVRTFGQILGHVANANYMLCGPVHGTPMVGETGPGGVDYEKTTAKSELQKALTASFAFCEQAYALVTDRNGGEAVLGLPIGPTTKLGSLAFNNAHLMELYGNLVTYLRAKGLVPPSSQGPGR